MATRCPGAGRSAEETSWRTIAEEVVSRYLSGMSWLSPSGPPIMDGEDELTLKLEFAAYLATHPGKVREAAYMVFRNDRDQRGDRYFGRAMQAINWESDPIVQEELERLRSPEDVGELLPTPNEIKMAAWDIARNGTVSAKDRLTAIELLANMTGLSTKNSGTNINIDNRQVHNVMAIPGEMTVDEAKEYFLKKQAMRQIADARPA